MEGQRLKEDGDNFKQKLDTQELFEDWSRKVRFLENSTALYCTVLYCTVLYCTVLYCTVLYCTVLYWGQLFEARLA